MQSLIYHFEENFLLFKTFEDIFDDFASSATSNIGVMSSIYNIDTKTVKLDLYDAVFVSS